MNTTQRMKMLFRRIIRDRISASPVMPVIHFSVSELPPAWQYLFQNAKTIGIYAPRADEISIAPWLADLCDSGINQTKSLCYPRISDDGATMTFYRVTSPEKDLTPGSFSINEPSKDLPQVPIEEIDILFVPALAFDSKGNRLGRGKGYYDHYLEQAFHGKAIGIIPENRLFEHLITEKWDRKVDAIMTENHFIVPTPVDRAEPIDR
ncbi:MAG TPA: 5-formyltetrahydrofolate cyclo-ligase [Bacillota bacterium]|nr:5-formyltetrahydrofolate cyclo-ligase [Bacillota bacterium]